MEGLLHDPDSQFAMICCSLAKEFDRVAYLRYYLTKALYEDDIKYILTQIGPSYSNRAEGGDDGRMIDFNKREAETPRDAAKKPRASHTTT